MEKEENKVTKQQNKAPKQSAKKEESKDISMKMDELIEKYARLHEDLELCIDVNRIMIKLLGGVAPGRKNLDCVQVARLRMEGVKVKDLARMQGISETAMHRYLKELREEGLLK